MSRISSAPASFACTKQACVLRFEAVHCDSRMLKKNKQTKKNSPSIAGIPGVLWNPHWVSSFWRTETSWGKWDFVCLVKTPQHPQKPLDVSVTLDWLWCWHFQRNRNIVEQCEQRQRTTRNTQINTCCITNYSPSIFIGLFKCHFLTRLWWLLKPGLEAK